MDGCLAGLSRRLGESVRLFWFSFWILAVVDFVVRSGGRQSDDGNRWSADDPKQ
jgi:hypothetical protein